MKELSKKDAVYERLASALAPSIYENMDIKKGILLQLFSGSNKDFDNAGRGKFRSVANDFYRIVVFCFQFWSENALFLLTFVQNGLLFLESLSFVDRSDCNKVNSACHLSGVRKSSTGLSGSG